MYYISQSNMDFQTYNTSFNVDFDIRKKYSHPKVTTLGRCPSNLKIFRDIVYFESGGMQHNLQGVVRKPTYSDACKQQLLYYATPTFHQEQSIKIVQPNLMPLYFKYPHK